MMRSMFAGVSGMRSHQSMMDVIGDNIANVNSTGFKASRVVFQDTLNQVMREGNAATDEVGGVNPSQVGLGVKLNAIDAVITQGAITSTGRPSDVAVQGTGYFVVKMANSPDPVYTRSGSFTLDAESHLVDPAGGILLAEDGSAITLPENIRAYTIGADGMIIAVNQDGSAAEPVGPIGLATFENPAGLIKIGDGHLRQGVASGEPIVVAPGQAGGTLVAGALEMSNVDLAQEFTNMMIAQRGFQANSKVISTADELLSELVNLKR
ncbi:MAG: flgE [Frankiales bacterium]|jgi:flagellar hook protein FlgE|nr:flgE [Frankiales bacterium]